MTEPPRIPWDGSLENLFAVLDEACRTGTLPPRPPERAPSFTGAEPPGGGNSPLQPELFTAPEIPPGQTAGRRGPAFPVPEPSRSVFPDLRDSFSAALLREISADAFDAVVHAWMSELPIEAEITRFGWNVISTALRAAARKEAESAGVPGTGEARGFAWAAAPEARSGAEKAASDRGDPDARVVLEAAYKVRRETDRLMGLLRFAPAARGGGSGTYMYVARCSPDHYILPGLAEHFVRRFGECSWAVIDEKRNLVLARKPGGEVRLFPLGAGPAELAGAFPPRCFPDFPGSPDSGNPGDYFENLWRNYYQSINNPDRNNPGLRRQFMPRRYWKYLPELR
jgi:probable DNA metabolism protein